MKGTYGSCSREPVPVAMGTGLAQVWVRVQLELPIGYPCYALRTTPPLVFQAKKGVVAGRDNAGGHNQETAGPITCPQKCAGRPRSAW